MPQAIRMPKLGNTMESGLVAEWLVDEGEAVEDGTVLAVVESEKAEADIVADRSGTLARVDVAEGAEVTPGTVIGVVVGPDEDVDEAPKPGSRRSPDEDEAKPADVTEDGTTEGGQAGATSDTDEAGVKAHDRSFASPHVRRQARATGVSLDEISGTGPGGRITESDIIAAQSRTGDRTGDAGQTAEVHWVPESTLSGVTVTDEQELSPHRQTIATRLTHSASTIPQVTLNRAVSVERTLNTAEDLSGEFDADIGFMDLLMGATVRALDHQPSFNAWFDSGRIKRIAERNIAIAVDAPGGLVAPVLREVDDRSLPEIASRRRELTRDVREGHYDTDMLAGGTFTISNLGMFGVDSFDPIIDPPQIGILGVGRINGDDDRTCTLSLSFDHRVVDGADAARFLDTIETGLGAPAILVADRSSAGQGTTTSPTNEPGLESVEELLQDDLQRQARDVAQTHAWPTPTFDVELGADGPVITVSGHDDASTATLKRLTYAACRESSFVGTVAGLRDPAVTVD